MSERVATDRAYYAEFNKSRLDTRPDIDIPWYFDRVEDLERQLAEALRKVEHYEKTVSPSQENVQAQRMLTEKLAEAQAKLKEWNARFDPHYDEAVKTIDLLVAEHNVLKATLAEEREAHKATMVLVMELLDEIRAQWGDDYLWLKWGLDEQIATIRARP